VARDSSFTTALNVPSDVLEVMGLLESAGYPSFLVGGCVRDALLGRQAMDYDLATPALVDELKKILVDYRIIDTGSAYGTVTLLTGQRELEVTTFRADGSYSDSRHPDSVSFSTSIEDDLSRRDFTVNAVAYSPTQGWADPFGGRADLEAGVLRAVGNAGQRLQEDALRIMRALRLAATLGLRVDPGLSKALHDNKGLLQNISPERISAELMRLLSAENDQLLPVLLEYGEVLAVPIPEIGAMIGLDQRSPWHTYDVWEHTVRALVAVSPDDLVVRLTLLLHDIGKPPTFTIDETGRGHFYAHAPLGAEIARDRLQALRFDKRTVQQAYELIRSHFAPIAPDTVLRWLRRLGEQQLRRLFAVKIGDMCAHIDSAVISGLPPILDCLDALDEAISSRACYSLGQLAVKGGDLIAIGVEPGPRLGALLEALLDTVVEDGQPNDYQRLMAAARQLKDLDLGAPKEADAADHIEYTSGKQEA